MVSADGPAKVAQNNGHTGDLADFKTDVEPVAFCRAHRRLVAGFGRKRQSRGIGGRILVNAARHDHDGGQDQRHRICNFH